MYEVFNMLPPNFGEAKLSLGSEKEINMIHKKKNNDKVLYLTIISRRKSKKFGHNCSYYVELKKCCS